MMGQSNHQTTPMDKGYEVGAYSHQAMPETLGQRLQSSQEVYWVLLHSLHNTLILTL